MASTHTPVDHEAPIEVRAEPVDVTVGIIPAAAHDALAEDPRTTVVRDLLERQLEVGHDLGAEIVDAITTVSVAVAHAPTSVIGEIRGGATLPTALAQSGKTIREVVTSAGSTLRTAVGDYVGHQATLPNAVIVGASGIAETVLHAQGKVAAAAVTATYTVATVVVHGGDVREVIDRERHAVGAAGVGTRNAIEQSWSRAREEIRGAVEGFDDRADAFAESE